MAQDLSTCDPSLSPTHLSIRRGRATTTHYTHHQVSLMVSQNTTLVSSLGLRIGPACEAGLSAGMRRERVTTNKKGKKKEDAILIKNLYLSKGYGARKLLSELSDKLLRFHVKLTFLIKVCTE